MRSVVVLAEAAEDIEKAGDFYDAQEPGVGVIVPFHFSLTSKALLFITESTFGSLAFLECSPTAFRSESITAKQRRKPRYSRSWICGETLVGFERS
jgi:hypothetical protein